MVQDFGLTMEGQALAWFQTLKSSVLYDFEVLVKHFIDSYSKIGIKHNTVTKILGFKQKDIDTIRECLDRLKTYIARCPKKEMPSQERLISCFLEGLRSEILYTQLFAKGDTNFDECCYDAQRLDDNCEFLKTRQSLSSTSVFSDTSKNLDVNAIVDALWKRMKQEQRGPMMPRSYPMRSYGCGTCGGPHPMERCPTTNPLKWCDTC